jgi:GntR family transcriptional regulator, transcriptional repressor for pyruvate dehydrogenase complex
MTPFRGVDRSSAVEAVRSQLEEAIVSGQLQVGERLPSEHELAKALGVSRPVVREALGSLRALGFVVSRNGRGSFVSSSRERPLLLGRYSLEELHEIRSLLEVQGAGLAAQRRSRDDLRRLRTAVEALEACGTDEQWVKLDAAFHVTLAAATENQLHAHLVEYLREVLIEQSQVVSAFEGRIPQANAEHRAIYEAVCARDSVGAQRAVSTHLLNAYRT